MKKLLIGLAVFVLFVVACSNNVGTTLKSFSSLSDLQAWLDKDQTDKQPYSDSFSCYEFALTLQQNAAEDGYLINLEFIIMSNIDGQAGGHVMNVAVIDDRVYFIEPQTDDIYPMGLVG